MKSMISFTEIDGKICAIKAVDNSRHCLEKPACAADSTEKRGKELAVVISLHRFSKELTRRLILTIKLRMK